MDLHKVTKSTIQMDKGHSKSTNESRTTAWNDLTDEFHWRLSKTSYRTTKQLKTLYENIKHKIKRNIGQGYMAADVKTAKDIPLSLFLELKNQYEAEMDRSANPDGHERSYGREPVPTGEHQSGGAIVGGDKSCGARCKCRSYTYAYSSNANKKSSQDNMANKQGIGLKAQENMENWTNSKGDKIVIVNNKTVIIETQRRGAEQERKSRLIETLPSGIGIRYPRNLSKNIYHLSDSSDDDDDDDEAGDNEDSAGEDSNNATMNSSDSNFVIHIGNGYKAIFASQEGHEGIQDDRENNAGIRDNVDFVSHNGNHNNFNEIVDIRSNRNQNHMLHFAPYDNKMRFDRQHVGNGNGCFNPYGNQMTSNKVGRIREQCNYQINNNTRYAYCDRDTDYQNKKTIETTNENHAAYNGQQSHYESLTSTLGKYEYNTGLTNKRRDHQINHFNPFGKSAFQSVNNFAQQKITNQVNNVKQMGKANPIDGVTARDNTDEVNTNISCDEEVIDDEIVIEASASNLSEEQSHYDNNDYDKCHDEENAEEL